MGLQLPPVHGYGIPTILNQWRENEDRQQDFEIKKQQLDMQKQQQEALIEDRKSQRISVSADKGFKLLDYAKKIEQTNPAASMKITKDAIRVIKTVFPELEINEEDLSPSSIENSLPEIELKAMQEAYDKGDFKRVRHLKTNLLKRGNITKEVADLYQEKEKKDTGYTLGENAIRFDENNKPIAYGKPKIEQNEVIETNPDGTITIVRGPGAKPTKGRIKTDEEFAKELVDWRYKGGAADTAKSIDQLRLASSELQSGKNITGPILNLIPDFVKAGTNPDSINIKEAVQEVVQRNLRDILGAQFTQKEGENLVNRAYNSALDEKVNAVRVSRLMDQIARAAEAKEAAAQYFEKNGTLTGFTGKVPTLQDFVKMDFEKASGTIKTADDYLNKFKVK